MTSHVASHFSVEVGQLEGAAMYFEGSFRRLGTVDIEPLARLVDSFGEQAWSEYIRRQQRFAPHRDTHTIPLLFDEDMRHADPTPWPRFEQAKPVLAPVLNVIRHANSAGPGEDEGYFVRIILTRLGSGAVITPHRDRGESIMQSHRYHVAIRTNDHVDFAIDGEVQHFAPGEIWEINNRKYHAVRNLGQDARIHLILDYVVPGEEVQEPEEFAKIARVAGQ